MFDRIVAGYGSDRAGRDAVRLAAQLTSALGSEVLAGILAGELQVIAGTGLNPTLASYAFSAPSLPQVEDEIHAETEAGLQRAVSELDDGVPVQRETVRGEPAAALIERSAELDLLMLGSRAYGPLRHALLGSVSARVMRESHCPVLIVPRGTPQNPRDLGTARDPGATQDPGTA
ncbi:MAG: universal stress protein [Solirubrobacterales bacterium]